MGWAQSRDQVIKFWCRSASLSGSGKNCHVVPHTHTQNSNLLCWRFGGGLCSLSTSSFFFNFTFLFFITISVLAMYDRLLTSVILSYTDYKHGCLSLRRLSACDENAHVAQKTTTAEVVIESRRMNASGVPCRSKTLLCRLLG